MLSYKVFLPFRKGVASKLLSRWAMYFVWLWWYYHYFCKRWCQQWRYTCLLLWWQQLHSQGIQDVCVVKQISTTHCTDAYGSQWLTKEHWMKRWWSCWSHQTYIQVSSLNLTIRGKPVKRRWRNTLPLLMPCWLIIVTMPSLISSLVTIHLALPLPLPPRWCTYLNLA